MHLNEERGLVGQGEHSLLDHGTLDVVVLDDDVLLEDFDGVELVGALALGQHHLRERSVIFIFRFPDQLKDDMTGG